MARGEFTRDSAPPFSALMCTCCVAGEQLVLAGAAAENDMLEQIQPSRWSPTAWSRVSRWSRASRPRPRPSSSASTCSPSSPSSSSGCCHTAWPVDAQQGRSLDEFILYDWDLRRTLGALNENDYYARVLCVCVSLTVTLRSVLEWCAYEYKGTGSRCSYGGFECWVTFRGPIVSTRRP